MAKTDPFHTDSEEYPPKHREVYHDQTDCIYGKAIEKRHRKNGKGSKPHCLKCEELA